MTTVPPPDCSYRNPTTINHTCKRGYSKFSVIDGLTSTDTHSGRDSARKVVVLLMSRGGSSTREISQQKQELLAAAGRVSPSSPELHASHTPA